MVIIAIMTPIHKYIVKDIDTDKNTSTKHDNNVKDNK